MLSRLCESDPCKDTSGCSRAKSTRGDDQRAPRAIDHCRFPSIVLISPLCASSRNGCASFQAGAVLVEKRWWNTTTLAARSARARSGYSEGKASGRTIAL